MFEIVNPLLREIIKLGKGLPLTYYFDPSHVELNRIRM